MASRCGTQRPLACVGFDLGFDRFSSAQCAWGVHVGAPNLSLVSWLTTGVSVCHWTPTNQAPGQPIYGITGADSPCKRDLIGEMATAARKNGLQFGAYFSKARQSKTCYYGDRRRC